MKNRPYVYTRPLTNDDIVNEREEAKKWLDSVSESMCLAKWLHTSLHLTNGRTHSCYHPPVHKISIDQIKKNPSALHNTDQKKFERHEMLSGQRPSGCKYCWSIEDAPLAPEGGHRSDRHYRSSEHWAKEYRELVLEKGSADDVNPTYVEVNFNQACNFKCAYCSPHLSTEWEKEIEKFGPYPTTEPHNNLDTLKRVQLMPLEVSTKENPYVEAFWRWWPELYNTLLVFRMTGGEPLMDKNTFKVLDYVAENPKGDLELSVTSNMCPPDPKLMDKFIDKLKKIQDYTVTVDLVALEQKNLDHEKWPRKVVDKSKLSSDTINRLNLNDYEEIRSEEIDWYDFESRLRTKNNGHYVHSKKDTKACKHFGVYVSVDAYGKQAEYIRHGLNYNQLIENTKRVLYETHFTTVSFINTFNLLSIPTFKDFLKEILNLRKWVYDLKDVPGKNPMYDSYCSRQRVFFDIPTLRKPVWLNLQILPESHYKYLDEALAFMEENSEELLGDRLGFQEYEIDKLRRNIGWIKSNPLSGYELETAMKDFYLFFNEYDKRRNTDFILTFPEFQDFFNQCKDKAIGS